MANLFHYLNHVKELSFYDRAPNEVDFLILTELAYLPYNDLLTDRFDLKQSLRLADLATAYFQKHGKAPLSSIVNKDRLQLLEQAADSKRFRNVKALGFVDDYSRNLQKQFSALTYRLMTGYFLVAFRGTDDSIIGWKEDFHMTYMTEIPSQVAAKTYLTKAIEEIEGQFYLAGHSKGGNLALFAASQISPKCQDRLVTLSTYDAPGLHRELVHTPGYRAIKERIRAFIPQDSIIGMMLETPKQAQIVKSKTFGLLQHLTFSWEIQDDYFALIDHVTSRSQRTDQTLTLWKEGLSDRELRDFFDSFFGIFLEAGIERLSDFEQDLPKKVHSLITITQHLPSENKALLHRLIKQLFRTHLQVMRQDLTPPTWTDVESLFRGKPRSNAPQQADK